MHPIMQLRLLHPTSFVPAKVGGGGGYFSYREELAKVGVGGGQGDLKKELNSRPLK